jgi:hypothetical protein
MSFPVRNNSLPNRGYFVYAMSGEPLPGPDSDGVYLAANAPVDDATAIMAVPNDGYMFAEWCGLLNMSGQCSPYLKLVPGYPASRAGALFIPSSPEDPTAPIAPTPPALSVDQNGQYGGLPALASGLSAALVGVISYNSVFYTVQATYGVGVYKSTNLFDGAGATWTEVGGDCPVTFNYPYLGGTPWFDGDHTITVAAMTTGGHAKLCDFDLSTETWGLPYGDLAAPGMLAVYALYKRQDGSFLLIGEQDGSNVLPACIYASGVWGTPFDIAMNMLALPGCPSFPITNPPKSCMDDNGNVYIFWQLQGPTIIVDDAHAGAASAWYGRAFYQKVASDNSLPSGSGGFYDFPGQDTAVPTGSAYPVPKDGDLAWNTTKQNLIDSQVFSDKGGDCFGKPCIVGTSIFVPIRRKIPGTSAFYNPNTNEQLYTYATFYEGEGLPTPGWTELTAGCDPVPAATSTNKCDAVGNVVVTENLLWGTYIYSNLNTTGDPTDDNTAAQSCSRLCCCAVADGVPDFNWICYTIYDRDAAAVAFPDAALYWYVFDAILSVVDTVPVVMANYGGGNNCEPR